jgi:MFS family permease
VALPFFYGWTIVAIAMVAGFFSAGVSNITMAVVLKPISDELGWSRSLTAAAVTTGSILGGVLSPLFGPLADRWGPRLLLPAGGALVGLLVIGVGSARSRGSSTLLLSRPARSQNSSCVALFHSLQWRIGFMPSGRGRWG